jgi:hypothetical protein
MKVQIFTYCDFAAFYNGKLCITGACDQLFVPKTPAVVPLGYIVLKLGMEPADEGVHLLQTSIIDADGRQIAGPPPFKMAVKFDKLSVGNYEQKTQYQINMITNFLVPKYGEYSLELADGGNQMASIPFLVLPVAGGKA